MSQASIVSWLALRELWMSFRLLVVLVVTILVGALVALLRTSLPVTMERLAFGLGAAAIVAGVVAAWSVATERRRGRTGWLIARTVPRATYLSGWFVAVGLAVLVGQSISSALGWLAAASVAIEPDPLAFGALASAALAGSLASVALGTLVGVLWPPALAAGIVVVIGGILGAAIVGGIAAPGWLPAAGAFAALAAFREGEAALGPALVAAGLALVVAGVLLVLARIALERVEL